MNIKSSFALSALILGFLGLFSACAPSPESAPIQDERYFPSENENGARETVPVLPPEFEKVKLGDEIGRPVGRSVDGLFSNYRELEKVRTAVGHATDQCDRRLDGSLGFSDKIAFSVAQHFAERDAQLYPLASIFSIPANAAATEEVSLMSHPFCRLSASTLAKTIGSSKVPSATTIARMNAFTNQLNQLRSEYLNGHLPSGIEAAKLWSKFFMCLSYTESLTSADTTKSVAVAKKYNPSGYRKPSGVKFYEDPSQSAASRLNIGLFQFTPSAGGNIFPCIRQWNRMYPSCAIDPNAKQAEMIKTLGSAQQVFNAFCGIEKLTGSFSVQVNSSASQRTHPDNLQNGRLKSPGSRCVSFAFNGQSYNHFGPLQNSTGRNLTELMSCVAAE